LALAALSIYQARTIPFFAVVAAPFLALNVQEWSRRRPFSETLQRLRFAADWVGVLVGMILLVLAWPGWLQTAPYQPRGWSVEPDGSLVRLAEQLKRYHAESRFRPDRFALTFSPEVAHYLAWFCPEEKGFLDSRWPLFDRVAEDYVVMRHCLLGEGVSVSGALATLIEAHHIDRILLHDTDWERTARAYRHLFLSPEWELLAVEGGATLFARHNGSAPSPEAFDSRRAAYHPAPDQLAPPSPRPPRPPRWFDAFRRRLDNRSADREQAAMYLLTFDLQAEKQSTRLVRQWLLAHATGLIGCGWATEPAGTASSLAVRLELTPLLPSSPVAEQFAASYLTMHGSGPAEPLLLAVRAARRALAVNPDDAGALLLLGEAYFRLARQTRELNWVTTLPDLGPLRQTQMLTALEQAALLRPDLEKAHDLLAQLYWEEGQLDRCLDHLRARLRIAEKSAREAEPIAALRAYVEKLEQLVNQSEKTYQANLPGRTDPSKVLDRARLAAGWGLSRKALQMLLESYPAIFGKAGVEYQLDLMLQAGQGYEVRDWLEPKHESQIDFATFHWVKARAAASCGDYAEAEAELDRGSEPLRRIGLSSTLLVPIRSAVALHVARAVLTRPSIAEGAAGRAAALSSQFRTLDPLLGPAELLRREADRRVLRGLLALESGAVETARQHFRAALDVWGGETATETGAGLDFPARPLAQQMIRRLHE
jgi:tetratricopeptide (TPR) repeat protein